MRAIPKKVRNAEVPPADNGRVNSAIGPRLWPGTLFTPEDAGKARIVARPAGLNPKTYPPEVRYTVQLPEHQAGDKPKLVRRRFREARRRAEERLASEYEAAGKRFTGPEVLDSLDPRVVPDTPLPPAPQALFRSTVAHLLEAALDEYDKFRTLYPECLQALRDGIVGIVWPAGTNYHTSSTGFPAHRAA